MEPGTHPEPHFLAIPHFLSIQYIKLPVYVVMGHSMVETRGKKPTLIKLLVNSYKEMSGNELWDTRT